MSNIALIQIAMSMLYVMLLAVMIYEHHKPTSLWRLVFLSILVGMYSIATIIEAPSTFMEISINVLFVCFVVYQLIYRYSRVNAVLKSIEIMTTTKKDGESIR